MQKSPHKPPIGLAATGGRYLDLRLATCEVRVRLRSFVRVGFGGIGHPKPLSGHSITRLLSLSDSFHTVLSTKQLGIHAVGRHELGVRAGFHGSAVFEHRHLIRIDRIGHAMRDHDDGPATAGKFTNRLQDQGLAFHVDATGRLIEHIDGTTAQERPSDGDALTLAAR